MVEMQSKQTVKQSNSRKHTEPLKINPKLIPFDKFPLQKETHFALFDGNELCELYQILEHTEE